MGNGENLKKDSATLEAQNTRLTERSKKRYNNTINEVTAMEKEAKLRIVDIFLKYEIDDDSCMLNDYGKLSDHWETNALKLGQHWLIPNQKWHDLRGKERRDAYRYANEDKKRVEDWLDNKWYYVGAIIKTDLEIRINKEPLSTSIYESVWRIESDDPDIGWYHRDLLNETRKRLSNIGFSMLELDAAFEKYAKLSDKELQWEVT